MQTGSSTALLRAPELKDFDAWSEVWAEYLAFYETTRDAEVHKTLFSRLLSDNPNSFQCLVAERSGVLVGLVHFLFHPHAWRIEGTCYLQDLYVAPSERGTGLGRQLIEAVYAAADAKGAPSVYWLTQDFNVTARQLYDRVGEQTPFIRYNRPTPPSIPVSSAS